MRSGLSALPLTVMLWSALRFSPLRTAISVLLTVLLLGGFAGLGLAGFRASQPTLEVAILLVYLCLLAVLPMVLALTVSEHRAAVRRLLLRASTDPLSGLPNRGAFEAQVRQALLDPSSTPLALAYLDLDNLKLVNDTASHRAGDALIGAVANALRAQMQPGDLLAHLGGDEFVVLLHNASPTIARERAQALLRTVENSHCAVRRRPLRHHHQHRPGAVQPGADRIRGGAVAGRCRLLQGQGTRRRPRLHGRQRRRRSDLDDALDGAHPRSAAARRLPAVRAVDRAAARAASTSACTSNCCCACAMHAAARCTRPTISSPPPSASSSPAGSTARWCGWRWTGWRRIRTFTETGRDVFDQPVGRHACWTTASSASSPNACSAARCPPTASASRSPRPARCATRRARSA